MKKLIVATLLSFVGSIYASIGNEMLRQQLFEIIDTAPGTVGVAYVTETDTVTVNNGVRFPMMSVFKLHEALAVADALERSGASFDSILNVKASEIDRDTWSPMLKTVGDGDFTISVGELVKYALVSSDNNASNILFDRIISPIETNRYVCSISPDTAFSIAYSEKEMKANHALSYCNYSSPLAAALLLRKVFTEQLVSPRHTEVIRDALLTVTTGQDRVGAPLRDIPGIKFAHKTGSGYRNEAGELIAFNDIAYIMLPDGKAYSLAIMIRDFAGTESEAAEIMSRISEIILNHYNLTKK